ncbi:hypothetical protein D3C85_1743660 [compost metagenome]
MWKIFCTPCSTSGRPGLSDSLTIAFMRRSFSPCAERSKSTNMSIAIGLTGWSWMIEKDRMDASCRFTS